MSSTPIIISSLRTAVIIPSLRTAVVPYCAPLGGAALALRPVVGNSVAAAVNAALPGVERVPGTLVQSIFSGDVADVRGTAQILTDASGAAREAGIAEATSGCPSVTAADFAFPFGEPDHDQEAS